MNLHRPAVTADALRARNEHALDLGVLVSLAVHVEPSLLRHMRLEFLPRSDASAEADLWFSGFVQTRSARGLVFLPEAAAFLRETLGLREDRERVWSHLRLVHADLAPLLQLEEKLGWMAVSGATQSAIADELATVLSAMEREPTRGPDLAAWAARALPRQHELVQGTTAAWTLALAASTHLGRPPSMVTQPPVELAEVSPPPTMLPPRATDVVLEVRRTDDWLELRHATADAKVEAQTLTVPSTDPRIVVLGGAGGTREIVTLRPDATGRVRVPSEETSALVSLGNLRGERWQVHPLGGSVSAEGAATRSLRWLHVSDPTFRADELSVSGRTVAELEHLCRELGKPDLMFLTGDVSYSARPEEFRQATEVVGHLRLAVRSGLPLFIVPGNHDYSREVPGVSSVSNDAPWWHEVSHPDRQALRRAFRNYSKWASSMDAPRAVEGVVPGDRLATVWLLSGLRVGVLALNTAYDARRGPAELQNVAISANQIRALLGIAGPKQQPLGPALAAWCASHDFTFLVTHHSPRMFPNRTQDWFRHEVAPNFDIHLCGATHGRGGLDRKQGLVFQASPAQLVDSTSGSNADPGSLTFGQAAIGEEIHLKLTTVRFKPDRGRFDATDPYEAVITRADVAPASKSNDGSVSVEKKGPRPLASVVIFVNRALAPTDRGATELSGDTQIVSIVGQDGVYLRAALASGVLGLFRFIAPSPPPSLFVSVDLHSQSSKNLKKNSVVISYSDYDPVTAGAADALARLATEQGIPARIATTHSPKELVGNQRALLARVRMLAMTRHSRVPYLSVTYPGLGRGRRSAGPTLEMVFALLRDSRARAIIRPTDIWSVLSRPASFNECLRTAIREIAAAAGVGYAQIFLLAPSKSPRGDLVCVASVAPPDGRRYRIAARSGVIAQAFDEKKAVNISDVTLSHRYIAAEPMTKSELAIPIIRSNEAVGVINCESPRVGAFSEEDADVLAEIGLALGEILHAKGWDRSATKDILPQLVFNPQVSEETTPESPTVPSSPEVQSPLSVRPKRLRERQAMRKPTRKK